jgi:hypothetical protein
MHKASLQGTVDVVENEWCSVEIEDQSGATMMVKLSASERDKIKEGDQIIFYYRVDKQ